MFTELVDRICWKRGKRSVGVVIYGTCINILVPSLLDRWRTVWILFTSESHADVWLTAQRCARCSCWRIWRDNVRSDFVRWYLHGAFNSEWVMHRFPPDVGLTQISWFSRDVRERSLPAEIKLLKSMHRENRMNSDAPIPSNERSARSTHFDVPFDRFIILLQLT